MWHIYTRECYLALEREEILIYITIWKTFEGIMQKESGKSTYMKCLEWSS